MSKRVVQTWINDVELDANATNAIGPADLPPVKWDGSSETWTSYLSNIQSCLFSSSTKLRIAILSRDLTRLVRDAGMPPVSNTWFWNVTFAKI